jgi:hypothetical protein
MPKIIKIVICDFFITLFIFKEFFVYKHLYNNYYKEGFFLLYMAKGTVEILRRENGFRVECVVGSRVAVIQGLDGTSITNYNTQIGCKLDDHYPVFGWVDYDGPRFKTRPLVGIAHSPEEAREKARDKALEYADLICREKDLRFVNDPREVEGGLASLTSSE